MQKRRFSNQSLEQIIGHLNHFLSEKGKYNLTIDFSKMQFVITRARCRKIISKKRRDIREATKNMTKRQRRLSGTRKRTRPKIRSVKKGRTVELKGRVY